MCREAIKRFFGCRVILRELFICANFVNFEHPDALAIDCPHYQSYNILLPHGRRSCIEGDFMCGFASRDGERIVTFEEPSAKDIADEGMKYYEWHEALENGTRWTPEVESMKSQAVQELDSEAITYRSRLRAILEQEAFKCQPQLQAGQFMVRAPVFLTSSFIASYATEQSRSLFENVWKMEHRFPKRSRRMTAVVQVPFEHLLTEAGATRDRPRSHTI